MNVGAGAILFQERTLVVAAIAAMLRTAPELPAGNIEMIAFTFFAAISGATRAALEASDEASCISDWETHLERLGHAYLASFSS